MPNVIFPIEGGSPYPRKETPMKRIFPPMNDRPGKWMPAAALGYWLFAFWFNPFWMPLIADGFWNDLQFASWLDIVYHVVNALAVTAMFKAYAWDSLLNVQMYPGKFIKTVGIAVLLMLALALGLYFFPVPIAVDAYPINEMGVAVSAGVMVETLPVFGTLCHVLLTPIAVVGLFYIAGFAPMCCRKTWLGYLVVTALLILPAAFDILWRGDAEYVVPTFLLQLPMHWIACWSYQKADTVWAPLATLSIFNLVTSLLSMFLM